MEANVLLVKMAEMAVVENSNLLKTTLGSCVGVILHDGKKNIGGLAHIMLPESSPRDSTAGKFVDTAIPSLLNQILEKGGRKQHIRAYLAGGANMFKTSTDKKITTVGEKNIEASKRVLEKLQIPIACEETGGELGRTVVFDNHNGHMQVTTLSPVLGKGA